MRHAGGGAESDAAAVAVFERAFCDRFGGGAGVAFDRGRTALFAILRGLGIGQGDDVVTCAYTCHTVPQTIRALGARNIYIDIDPATLGPDPRDIARALTPRTRAIVLQHSYGWPADADAVLDLARRHGLPVVEDCCQTLGSSIGGRPVGAHGVAAFHSFQWNKPISMGYGGLAVVYDAALAERVRAYRDAQSRAVGAAGRGVLAAELAAFELAMYPRSGSLLASAFRCLSRFVPLPGRTDQDDEAALLAQLQHPERLTALQARIGCLELSRYEQTAAHRRAVAARILRALRECGYTVPGMDGADACGPGGHAAARVVPLCVPVRVRDPLAAIAGARHRGFELMSWFDVPLDPLAAGRPQRDYVAGSCPLAERATREIVLVPTGRRVSQAVVRRMIAYFRRMSSQFAGV